VQPFHKPFGLRAPDLGGARLDAFELQEKLVRMAIRTSAVLPAVVAEDGGDSSSMLLKGRQDVSVEQMPRRHREFGGVQTSPGVAGMTLKG